MKILYVAHTSGIGGASVALINLIKGMQNKYGVFIAVACPEPKGYLVDKLNEMNVTVFTPPRRYNGFFVFPKVKNPLLWIKAMIGLIVRYFWGVIFLSKVVKNFRPDIIHTNSSACVVGLDVAKMKRIPHVWHIREFIDTGFDWTFIPSNKSLYKRMYCKGNFNIAITKSVYDHFHLRKCDKYIYDGVIDTNRKINDATKLDFPYFLYVGNITRSKGVDVLIEQYLIFHKIDKKLHLVLAGPLERNIDFCDEMKHAIKEDKSSEFVHWLGKRDDVYELMKGALALIVPSRSEGFGFITVEAMYNKCLVIGHNIEGLKEQFDKGLSDTKDEIALRYDIDSELSEKMFLAVSNDFTEMKKRAFSVVLENYTIDKNSESIYDYYKNILITD